MIRRALIGVYFFTALSPAWGAAGKDGFQFLKLGGGARGAAVGNAGAAFADDLDSSFQNPAALAQVRSGEVSLDYAKITEEVGVGALSLAHPWGGGAWGLRWMNLRQEDIPGYDAGGARTGSVQAQAGALSAAYGRWWGRWLAGGVSLTQAQESLADASASALFADAGILYRPAFSGGARPLQFTADLKNVGSAGAFARDPVSLPRSMGAGVSFIGWSESVRAAVSARKSAERSLTLSAGLEVWLQNAVALRAGRDGTADAGHWTAGFGFRLKDIRVDYAFRPQGDAFDPVHRMSLSFRFGGAADRAYREGVTLMQRGDPAAAILKFKQALDLDPSHRRAVRALREAVRALEQDKGEER